MYDLFLKYFEFVKTEEMVAQESQRDHEVLVMRENLDPEEVQQLVTMEQDLGLNFSIKTIETSPPVETQSETTEIPCAQENYLDILIVMKDWASENSWRIGEKLSCSGSGYQSRVIYRSDTCCLEFGQHELVCEDEYGDGWDGGFLQINGVKFCEHFLGKNETFRFIWNGYISPISD